VPHNSKKTRPERRKARAGTTVRIDGLRVSREAWARVEALVAQLVRAGIPRAHRSGAMDLMLLQPDVAELLIVGGCRIYRCASCGGWTGDATSAMAHQDAHPEHELQGFTVPPA